VRAAELIRDDFPGRPNPGRIVSVHYDSFVMTKMNHLITNNGKTTFRTMNSLVKMSLESFNRAKSEESKEDNLISEMPYISREAAFGFPRNFLSHRFVYAVFSPRAGGLSVGINMVPGKVCNFNCVYCEVNRTESGQGPLNVAKMEEELKGLLGFIQNGDMARHPQYRNLPGKLLELRQVALSGDGEPTLAPNFLEAVMAAIHVRATSLPPPFKLVLITNGSGLDQPNVQEALKHFLSSDEIWIKMDGGSHEYLEKINRSTVPLDKIFRNTLTQARRRPVVIQSLFPAIDGVPPPELATEQYVERLNLLKASQAQIQLVQIYSVIRPAINSRITHLPLKDLANIARTVRKETGLRAEVF
jgi:wyosine [tRNA(Phe)-imidazoG37] synthetase (radical SAM superfamily)